jgi:rhodanese-related sulfurtransferase
VLKLGDHGMRAAALRGGFHAWEKALLPVEK